MSDKLQGGILAGSVDVSLDADLTNTTDNLGTTALTSASSGLVVSYWRQGGVRVAVTPSDLAAVNSAHSDGGMKEVDSTNMKGAYRFDWPDAAFATGADWVKLFVQVTGSYSWSATYALTTNVIQTGDSFALSAGIKKNTAKAAFPFAMTDSTNHLAATGLTVTATRSLDGAAFAACANAVTETASGWYKIDLAAADLNGNTVALKFTATGADQLNISLVTGAG